MGVTVDFFAYDTAQIGLHHTLDDWLKRGWVDDQLNVAPDAVGFIQSISSIMGSNKRWYDNIEADTVWEMVYPRLDCVDAQLYHDWFGQTFWDSDAHPVRWLSLADFERIYPPELVKHLAMSLENMWPIEQALDNLAETDSTFAAHIETSWIYTADGFAWLVSNWHTLFKRVHRLGARWGMLMWIWI